MVSDVCCLMSEIIVIDSLISNRSLISTVFNQLPELKPECSDYLVCRLRRADFVWWGDKSDQILLVGSMT